ncbi:Ser/Thr protein kinase, partial [Cryptosporidium canis]
MKDKTPEDSKRGEIEAKAQSGPVSSFHADAPTFQPRSGLVVGVGAGPGSVGGELGSGLTASAQPFIPSSIRHNTGSVVDHGERGGFQMAPGGYSGPKQSVGFGKEPGTFAGLETMGGPADAAGGNGPAGPDFEGLLLGGTASSGQKSSPGLQEESQPGVGPGIHGMQYGPGAGGLQAHGMGGHDPTGYFGDSGGHGLAGPAAGGGSA